MCLREKKSAQIREILISESAWEEMTCLFAPSLGNDEMVFQIDFFKLHTKNPGCVEHIFRFSFGFFYFRLATA